jgi:dimethylaniline monooxygenase (N-oxide forming)
MTQRIAVIGAGPSGLTTAKAVVENGMEPVVFEASDEIGGLWKAKGDYVWNDMRTNLSKWTCAFSDHPWEPEAEEFPLGSTVENYLCDYAARFGVDRKVSLSGKVESVTPSGGRWLVNTLTNSKAIEFDGVVLAIGVFSRAAWPALNGIKDFKVSHFIAASTRMSTSSEINVWLWSVLLSVG